MTIKHLVLALAVAVACAVAPSSPRDSTMAVGDTFDMGKALAKNDATLAVDMTPKLRGASEGHRPAGRGLEFGYYQTDEPTVEPTAAPTSEPTGKPTAAPTAEPTAAPSKGPTLKPTDDPTAAPSKSPTLQPTDDPTAAPSKSPTLKPTDDPTAEPSGKPTVAPTAEPTAEPTKLPTAEPTGKPTTAEPTAEPSSKPTAEPTTEPSSKPTTAEPTAEPSRKPTAEPTTEPTLAPTGPVGGPAAGACLALEDGTCEKCCGGCIRKTPEVDGLDFRNEGQCVCFEGELDGGIVGEEYYYEEDFVTVRLGKFNDCAKGWDGDDTLIATGTVGRLRGDAGTDSCTLDGDQVTDDARIDNAGAGCENMDVGGPVAATCLDAPGGDCYSCCGGCTRKTRGSGTDFSGLDDCVCFEGTLPDYESLTLTNSNDCVKGLDGNDAIVVNGRRNRLEGQEGNDYMYVTGYANDLRGGDGVDSCTASGSGNSVTGCEP